MEFLSATYAVPIWALGLAVFAVVGLACALALAVVRLKGMSSCDESLEERLAGRERSIEALRENERRMRELYETGPVGVFSLSADGSKLLMADAAAARLLGFATPEEGMEGFRPEILDPVRFAEMLDTLGAEESVDSFDIAVRGADGSPRRLGIWATLRAGAGRIDGAVMDVTAQWRATRELKDAHLFTQSIMDTLPDPLFYMGRNGAILHVNSAMMNFMGMERSALAGRRSADLVPGETAAQWAEAEAAVLAPEGMGRHDFTTWLRTRGGGRRDVSVRLGAVEDSAGRRIGLVGVVSDATDLLRAQGGLKRAEEAYRAAFDFSPQAIFATIPDGRLVRANDAAADLLGYDSPQSLLESVADVARDVYADGSRREMVLGQLRAEGTVRGLELDLKRADGSLVRAVLDLRAVADAEGALVRVEGLAEDAAQRRLREAAGRGAPGGAQRPEPRRREPAAPRVGAVPSSGLIPDE
jgi:PAS domain S-box-containing protein